MIELAASRPRTFALDHVVAGVLFTLGVVVIWLPQWPPMADLPQHAGQIALMHDLILGRSPWRTEVWVNLFTPYLLGYALAVPLSFIMPVVVALKCVITAAYAAFGLAGVAIRRELRGAPALDGCYFVSFLGFAYSWGLYTFLVAAPVGLAFIWLSIRFARNASVRRGVGLALLGCLLVFSHGLVFLFSAAIGAAIIWLENPRFGDAAVRALPFIPPVAVAGLILVLTAHQDVTRSPRPDDLIQMGDVPTRLQIFFTAPLGLGTNLPFACFLIIAAAPLLGRLRLNTARRESGVPLAITVGAMAFVPAFAWAVAMLYARLALFLPPAYAWLFRAPSEPASGRQWRAEAALLAAGSLVLSSHIVQGVRFSAEAADFQAVMARAEPGQRALGLVLDLGTASGPDPAVNEYLPSWYQAMRHGFVDYNFADLHEEVVRFRSVPPVQTDPAFPFHAAQFDWRRDDAGRYRYFFVRSAGPVPAGLFRGAACAPRRIAAKGEWSLYERCAGGGPTAA